MKDYFIKILVGFIGLVIAIFFAEEIANLYLRKAKLKEKLQYVDEKNKGYHYPDIGCYDKDLGWGLRSNSEDRVITSEFDVVYKINSQGLRDKETPYAKPPGEFRVLALGESTVMGEGIKYGERFTEIIEEALRDTEIINMGVWGFGMDQSFLQLKREGLKYKPDLVILFVIDAFMQRCKDFVRVGAFKPRFVLNSSKDRLILQDIDFVKDNFSKNTHIGIVRDRCAGKNEGEDKKKSIFKNSGLYTLITYYTKIKSVDKKLAYKDRDREYWQGIYRLLSEENKWRTLYSRDDFNKLIFLLLKNYKDFCNRHSTDFLVVYIDGCKPSVPLEEFCKTLDIPYLDLSSIMAGAKRVKHLRFQIDPHYSPFAHRVIGEYVADYLIHKYGLKGNDEFVYNYLSKF